MKTALIIALVLSNIVLAGLLLRGRDAAVADVSQTNVGNGRAVTMQERELLEARLREAEARQVASADDVERLKKLADDLRGEIAILHAGRSRGPSAPQATPLPMSRAVLNELLGNPETVTLAMNWIKADLRPRYASLVALQTHLTPAQREQVWDLLAERYATRMDLAAAGANNVTPELRKQLDAEHREKLAALVGLDGVELFEKSEVKPVTWERMQRLDERLRYEATPLDKQQYGALWPVLSNAVFYYKPPADEMELQALMTKRESGMTAALEQARTLLKPEQFTTLSRLLADDNAIFAVQMQTRVKAFEAARRRQPGATEAASPPAAATR